MRFTAAPADSQSAAPEVATGPESAALSTGRPRSIPSLDGIRCIAVLMVIVHHVLIPAATPLGRALYLVIDNGALGVSIFFVLSGFLISLLLLKEREKKGRIDLRSFYRRRVLRLLPALYVYIAVLALLSWLGWIAVDRTNLVLAIVNLYNYLSTSSGTPEIAHSWSLSMEWQFYMLWPVLLAKLPLTRARQIAWALIIASPLLRLGTYWLIPEWRGRTGMMLHTQADLLLWGCLAALYWNTPELDKWLHKLARPVLLAGAAVFLFAVSPVLALYGRGAYTLAIGQTVTGPLVALLMCWLVRRPETWLGRCLNHPVAVWVGLVSYSLYLWQQLLIWEAMRGGMPYLAARLALLVAVSSVSFYLVELPMQKLGHRQKG